MEKTKQQKAKDFIINNGVIIVMFILVIYTGLTSDNFLTSNNLMNILMNMSSRLVIALGIAGTARDLLFALDRQHVRGDRFAIKVFLPLVGQHAASRAHCRFDQSHNSTLLFLLLYLISAFAFDRFL